MNCYLIQYIGTKWIHGIEDDPMYKQWYPAKKALPAMLTHGK